MREEQSRLKEEHLCWGWALALHPGCVQEYIHCCFPPQVRAHRIVTSTDISSARSTPRRVAHAAAIVSADRSPRALPFITKDLFAGLEDLAAAHDALPADSKAVLHVPAVSLVN